LTLTEKERDRLWVLKARVAGKLRTREAAERLGVSERQVKRLVQALRERGDEAAIHGHKGAPSNRALAPKLRAQVLELQERRYGDYGPTLLAEKLAKNHKIRISRETLRSWLVAEGRWKARRSRRERHPWRERRARFGELVQLDTSIHDWLEGGEKAVLVAAIDDATSVVFGLFAEGDSVFANFDVIRSWVESHGRALGFYVDRHTHFSIADESGVQRSETTQIGRAMGELGVEMIPAYTPQAKGRVEKLFRTLQDRLVKELRDRRIRTIEAANRFLVKSYWAEYNEQFSRAAHDPHDAHRPLTGEQRRNLGRIFSWREERTLRPDETIQYAGRHFLLETRRAAKLRPGRKVEVLLDGTGGMRVQHEGRDLSYREVPAKAPRPRVEKRHPHELLNQPAPWTPPKTHPWRGLVCPGARRRAAASAASLPGVPGDRSAIASSQVTRGEGAARSPSDPSGLARERRPA
jgi:transposase